MMRTSKRLFALLFAMTLFAAACGSDDASETTETTEATEAAAPAEDEASEDEAMEDEATEDEAAEDEAMEDEATEDEATEDEAMEDEASEDEASNTIVDVASGAGDFTTLVAALQEAGLVETLSGEGPFTVFAPTDDAFADALATLEITAEDLLADPTLGDILTYHVVPGKVLSGDVVGLDGQDVETVNGATIAVAVDGDTVMINDATVTTVDVEASNGVIHVIDSVLLPPAE